MSALMPVYTVRADAESGEWMGEPEMTDETSTRSDWDAMDDTDDVHHDMYEHAEADEIGRPPTSGETRLLRTMWVSA